jgi:Flp pilus assembly protein TadD
LAALLVAEAQAGTYPRAHRVQDAVVSVSVTSMLGKHHGSGFCIGDGSWVVTCYHVLAYPLSAGRTYLPRAATVILPWTGEAETATVVATDPAADLALLRLESSSGGRSVNLPALPLAPRESIAALESYRDGEAPPLTIAGYPPPTHVPDAQESVSARTCDGTLFAGGSIQDVPMFVLEPGAAAGPGWSGGPLLHGESGAVLGVFHALVALKSAPDVEYPRAISGTRIYALLEKAGVKDFTPFLEPTDDQRPTTNRLSPSTENANLFRHEMRATLAALNGRWAIAEAERRAQIKLRPESARGHAGLAGALFVQGKREEAWAAFAESSRLDPRRARTYLSWGVALEDTGQLKEAEERLRRATELAPEDPEIWISLATLLQKAKRSDDARAALARAISVAPLHPLAQGLYGASLIDAGKQDEGIPILRLAAADAKQTPFANSLRATLLTALKKAGRWDEAETELRQIVTDRPSDASARYALAAFLRERGKENEARQEAQRCLDLKPTPAVEAAARDLLGQTGM